MGLSVQAIEMGLNSIAQTTPGIAQALGRVGYPEPRIRARGHATMLRTIVGQQVSVAAASSMWAKMVGVVGEEADPAEIYLLFAEGRPDIWPAGDLAVQIGLGKLLGLPERPSEKETRVLAEGWRPHRGAAAIFTWHCYNNAAL